MKKLLYLLTISLLVIACGGGENISVENLIEAGDMKAIKEHKKTLTEKQKELNQQIGLLDSVIGSKEDKKLPLVTTFQAKEENFDHYLELQGDVMTKQNVLIYPEMAGTLLRVHVKEGQNVRKGQLLASIDDGGMGSQLAQLQTQEALAKTTFERQKRLWDQKIGSEIQYLNAKANYEGMSNSVKQLQSQLGKSTIRAPFSGIIDDVIKDQGTVVSPGPGSEVFRIVNLTDMYVDVDIPESYLGNVTKGKEVKVYFPALGDSVVTKVRQTGNFINPGNRSFTAEIPVNNKNGAIKPNLIAKVQINDYTNEAAILIPQSVVSENAAGEQYVYIAEPDNNITIAKKSVITTGKTQGDFVEVLSGLPVGSEVILEGARSVREDQEIKVKASTKTE